MEHVTDIDKKDYIDECKEIVRTTIALEKIELSDHELTLLTEEIMDTSLSIGGDYSRENIRYIAVQYVRRQFLPRFQKLIKEDKIWRLIRQLCKNSWLIINHNMWESIDIIVDIVLKKIRLKFIIICWIKIFAKLIFLWKFIV